jgi:hypothetical protein
VAVERKKHAIGDILSETGLDEEGLIKELGLNESASTWT